MKTTHSAHVRSPLISQAQSEEKNEVDVETNRSPAVGY